MDRYCALVLVNIINSCKDEELLETKMNKNRKRELQVINVFCTFLMSACVIFDYARRNLFVTAAEHLRVCGRRYSQNNNGEHLCVFKTFVIIIVIVLLSCCSNQPQHDFSAKIERPFGIVPCDGSFIGLSQFSNRSVIKQFLLNLTNTIEIITNWTFYTLNW